MEENISRKFKNLLDFVYNNKYSSFYHNKYRKAGFAPESDFRFLEDVKKIPFLTREELAQVDTSELLFVPGEKVTVVSPTSGTTSGRPFIVFHSKSLMLPPTHEIYQKKLTVLILLDPFRLPAIYPTLKKAKLVFTGNIFNLPATCRLASKLGVNHIYTTPTLAIILKKYLQNYPDLLKNLSSFTIGGEAISSEKRKLLQKIYPNKKIFIIYGSSEGAGTPAVQCSALAERRGGEVLLHSKVEDCYYEIINPETKEEVPFGKEGELILTNFRNRATPIIRYRTGDSASFRENDCPCGAPGPLLQVWGRINYDSVRAGGFGLRTEMLEKPLFNLKDCLQDNFEGHIYENFVGTKPRIKVVLNLSLKEGVAETPEIKTKIENELLKNWQISPRFNLKKAVEAGLFEIPQINFVQFPRSAKSRRVLILH